LAKSKALAPFSVGDEVDLKIESLVSGGDGLARHRSSTVDSGDGFVVFVPRTAPNERVRARITSIRKNFAFAELVEVLEKSPARTTPPCPVAHTCGGCQWQHIEYTEQLRQKQNLVTGLLRKITGGAVPAINEIIPSEKPLFYRNRIQLHYEERKLGYHRSKTHDLVAIDRCLIAEDEINRKLPEIYQSLANSKSGPRRVEIKVSTGGEVVHSLQPNFAETLGFSQVNRLQNLRLVAYVLSQISTRSTQLWDLYGGSGNFLFAALQEPLPLKSLVLVESHPTSVGEARRRLTAEFADLVQNKASTVRIFESTSEEFLSSKNADSLETTTVVLDPPRSGCSLEVIEQLLAKRPDQLIYVSCDPATLTRDLGRLQLAYKIAAVQPLDLFPQTSHVEVVATLELASKS